MCQDSIQSQNWSLWEPFVVSERLEDLAWIILFTFALNIALNWLMYNNDCLGLYGRWIKLKIFHFLSQGS